MKYEEKPLRFEEHARMRMRQRGVTEDQVLRTVRRPDRSEPARRAGARRLTKRFSKTQRIIVIAEEEPLFLRIITAYKG